MRILVVEDDESIGNYLTKGLRESGHNVDHADNGVDALFMATTETFDAIVLDRMLPCTDGLSVLKSLRDNKIDTPVLILSAMAAVEDRIEGLRAGSDDYLTKPFSFSELLARLEVIVRRSKPAHQSSDRLVAGDLEIDLRAHKVSRSGRMIELQPREFRVLEFLMRYKGQLVTRSMLIEQVWDYHFDPDANVIDVHISRLRGKIDPKDADCSFIETIRGSGYILRDCAKDAGSV